MYTLYISNKYVIWPAVIGYSNTVGSLWSLSGLNKHNLSARIECINRYVGQISPFAPFALWLDACMYIQVHTMSECYHKLRIRHVSRYTHS